MYIKPNIARAVQIKDYEMGWGGGGGGVGGGMHGDFGGKPAAENVL